MAEVMRFLFLLSIGAPAISAYHYCGYQQYTYETELCCETTVWPNPGNRFACCGPSAYETATQMCVPMQQQPVTPAPATTPAPTNFAKKAVMTCEGTIILGVLATSESVACCGTVAYDSSTHMCYEKNILPLPPPTTPAPTTTPEPEPEGFIITCEQQRYEILDHSEANFFECCGRRIYDTRKYRCNTKEKEDPEAAIGAPKRGPFPMIPPRFPGFRGPNPSAKTNSSAKASPSGMGGMTPPMGGMTSPNMMGGMGAPNMMGGMPPFPGTMGMMGGPGGMQRPAGGMQRPAGGMQRPAGGMQRPAGGMQMPGFPPPSFPQFLKQMQQQQMPHMEAPTQGQQQPPMAQPDSGMTSGYGDMNMAGPMAAMGQPMTGQMHPMGGQMGGQMQPMGGQMNGQMQPMGGQMGGQMQPMDGQMNGQRQPMGGQMNGKIPQMMMQSGGRGYGGQMWFPYAAATRPEYQKSNTVPKTTPKPKVLPPDSMPTVPDGLPPRYITCGSNLWEVADGNPWISCCGAHTYDARFDKCSRQQKIDHFKAMMGPETFPFGARCNSDGTVAGGDPDTQGCCGDKVYEKETETCCGSTIQTATSDSLCCGGKNYQNYNGNLQCCDSLVFDPRFEVCAPINPMPSPFAHK